MWWERVHCLRKKKKKYYEIWIPKTLYYCLLLWSNADSSLNKKKTPNDWMDRTTHRDRNWQCSKCIQLHKQNIVNIEMLPTPPPPPPSHALHHRKTIMRPFQYSSHHIKIVSLLRRHGVRGCQSIQHIDTNEVRKKKSTAHHVLFIKVKYYRI